jgi:hypothetical protein
MLFNKNKDQVPADAVYIGRPSKWGNPFEISSTCTRSEAIAKFRAWLTPEYIAMVREELKGKDLVCFCAPKKCHGDVFLELLEEPIYNSLLEF